MKKNSFLLLIDTLCRLFIGYLHRDEFDRAIEIERKCREEKVIYKPAMLAACVKLWIGTKNSNEAINDLEKLQNDFPNFKIDEYNIINLLTLLIKENRLEKAYEILGNSSHCDPNTRFDLCRSTRHLLFAVRDYAIRNNSTENMSEQMLKELLKKGFCKRSNSSIVLGSVIKEYLDKKEFHKAFEAFEAFARQYHAAIQTIKLLTILLEISNASANESNSSFGIDKEQAAVYLHRIIDISQSLYEVKKVNVTFLVGLACAGCDQQLRRILMDPMIEFDMKAMEKDLEYLKRHSSVDAIITIARSARGLSHPILNEENLYDSLITQFELKNDFKSAMKLYDELIKDGNRRVSKTFNRILRNLLKKNNQELPEYLNESGVIN